MIRPKISNVEKDVNPYLGVSVANSVAQLDALMKNAKLQEAVSARTAAEILGRPPVLPGSDDMLAGGDIIINRNSNAPWIIAGVAFLVAMIAAAWIVMSSRPAGATPSPSPVVTTTVPTPTPPVPSSGGDYIEFY